MSCDESLRPAEGRSAAPAPSGDGRFAGAAPEGAADLAEGAPEGARRLSLPLSAADAASLRAGELCLLTGPVYTLRDAGHMRLLAELDAQEAAGEGDAELPYGLAGQAILYAGPTPAAAGRPFGAVGPTTASRMDFAAPRLYARGVRATIGKGVRSEEVRRACVEHGCVYLVAVGGAAAFLAKRVESSQTIGYSDLGTEALRRVEVVDFPAFVGIDSLGRDIYERA